MSERRSELKAVAAAEDLASKLPNRDFVQMTARMMDGWTQLNGRLISLAQVALKSNLAAAEEIRQCQSPAEVLDAQLRLMRETCDQCMDEARKIGEIVAKMSTDALGSLSLPR